MLRWQYFPRSDRPPSIIRQVVEAFATLHAVISSSDHDHESDEVLARCRPELLRLGFRVETGKKRVEKISVPVLFGENGAVDKAFEADAYHEGAGMVLEIEAGRAVVNNQFLKDIFQASLMHDVRYLGIAVRQTYDSGNRSSKDYEKVITFMQTMYASKRLQLPLEGIVVIGY